MSLRVLLVSPLPPPYGGISHWTAMIEERSKSMDGLSLKVLDISPRWRSMYDSAIWKRALGGGAQLIRDIARFFWSLFSFRPDVIHITTPGQLALVRDIFILFFARLFGLRSIYHIRFGRVPALLTRSACLEAVFFKMAVRLAQVVISIDKNTFDVVSSLERVGHSLLIPNCYDSAALPVVDAELKQVVFIGWVIPSKGIEELLDAWLSLPRDGWELLVVGPGDPDYISLLALRSDDSVRFLGGLSHQKAMEVLASSSLLVLPSHTEGFPNVVLEGMALGKAVIATDVGAIPEMLTSGCGTLVPVQNRERLAQAIGELMVNDAKRKALGTAALSRARTKFSLERIFISYHSIWAGRNSDI